MKFHSKIVGTTFAPGFRLAVERLEVGDKLALDWDPKNVRGSRLTPDQGAAVRVSWGNRHIGHLPDTGSATAQRVASHIREGGSAYAEITEITGGTAGKENRGVNILITLY